MTPALPEPPNDALSLAALAAFTAVLAAPPRWHRQANCNTELIDPDTFFPLRAQGGIAYPAKSICDGCPVALPCLATGLRETAGVWGGLSVMERREAVVLLDGGMDLDDVHALLTTRPPGRRGRRWPRGEGLTQTQTQMQIQPQPSVQPPTRASADAVA